MILLFKFLMMNNWFNFFFLGFSEFKVVSILFKSILLVRFIMLFVEFEIFILFLLINKILVYMVVFFCIRFMFCCIFYRFILIYLIVFISLNEFCFIRKKFLSIGCIFFCFEISCFEIVIFIL